MKLIYSLLGITLLTGFSTPTLSINDYNKHGHSNPEKSEWKLKKETENIKVYYRKSPDNRVNELKLTTTVNSSLSTLISVLRDVSNYPNWIYKCQFAESLGTATLSRGQYYALLDFPWPLQDRDMITHSHLNQNKKTKVVTIQGTGHPHHLQEKDGIVRIKNLELKWVLTPLPGGRVQIDYELLSDPGGVLPSWLINLTIDQGPMQSIKGLQKQVNLDKYRTAKLSYIDEL